MLDHAAGTIPRGNGGSESEDSFLNFAESAKRTVYEVIGKKARRRPIHSDQWALRIGWKKSPAKNDVALAHFMYGWWESDVSHTRIEKFAKVAGPRRDTSAT